MNTAMKYTFMILAVFTQCIRCSSFSIGFSQSGNLKKDIQLKSSRFNGVSLSPGLSSNIPATNVRLSNLKHSELKNAKFYQCPFCIKTIPQLCILCNETCILADF